MRNNGKGGMQVAVSRAAIICPNCGRPAYRKEPYEYGVNGEAYAHFGKTGTFWHVFDGFRWITKRKHWRIDNNAAD